LVNSIAVIDLMSIRWRATKIS